MEIFGLPAAIFFIIGNEFCERFSFYGMKAILILYLKDYIGFSANVATSISHAFNMVCYGTPLLGALLADSYLGKYRTILSISIVYSVGNLVMALTAIPVLGAGEGHYAGAIVGLLLIGIGTGGIKPCVAAFGGDQFGEGQENKLGMFFSMFYFSINAGSVLSMILTPILRAEVVCFKETSCYSLAFGVPCVLMLVAVCFFIIGGLTCGYKKNPPGGNIFGDVVCCICHALRRKFGSHGDQWRRHWLDWADDKYPDRLISDIKVVFNVMTVIMPVVMFWALFDQQGTRWTLQAQRLDGHLPAIGYTMKADQMQVMNACLILCFIPIFDKGIYPLLNKMGFAMRPLQRLGIGLVFTALSFIVSGCLELALEGNVLHPPAKGHGYITVINNLNKTLDVSIKETDILPNISYSVGPRLVMSGGRIPVNLRMNSSHHSGTIIDETYIHPMLFFTVDGDIQGHEVVVQDRKGAVVVAVEVNNKTRLVTFKEDITKPNSGFAWLNLVSAKDDRRKIEYLSTKNGAIPISKNFTDNFAFIKIDDGSFKFRYESGNKTKNYEFRNGGTYTLVFGEDDTDPVLYINTHSNQHHIFLQIPQYVVMTMGEIMVSITGLSFAYSQAPDSMKSVMQAGWLFTTFFGNAIDLVVAASQGEEDGEGLKHSSEFFLFAAFMAAGIVLFVFLAMRYKYVEEEPEEPEPSRYDGEMELTEMKENGTTNQAFTD